MTHRAPVSRSSSVRVDGHELHRQLVAPSHAPGVVMFVHHGGRIDADAPIARALEQRGIATLRVDLVDDGRDDSDIAVGTFADRIVETIDWVRADADLRELPLGLFGSGPSTAAALVAAARRPGQIAAVVCGNGRPDLAGDAVAQVRAPTLFIAGRDDEASVALDRDVARRFGRPPTLSLIEGVRRVLDDPAAAAHAAQLAADWFVAQFEVEREAMSRRGLGDPVC